MRTWAVDMWKTRCQRPQRVSHMPTAPTTTDVFPLCLSPYSGRFVVLTMGSTIRVASSTVGFGHLVQIVGIGLGVLIALSSVFLVRSVDLGGGVIIGGILAGCTVAVLVYGLGTLIAAQGQSLLASLDSAVNNSPFLSDDQKASIMGL